MLRYSLYPHHRHLYRGYRCRHLYRDHRYRHRCCHHRCYRHRYCRHRYCRRRYCRHRYCRRRYCRRRYCRHRYRYRVFHPSFHKWLKWLMLIHGIFFVSCFFIPMTGMFTHMAEGKGGNGGGIALLFWCIYFLPIGVLAYRHFSENRN